MTVAENIAFSMRMKGVPKVERAATVERVAKLLQIEKLLDRRPAQLSGGQRQRVAMGRALARNPAIFLFDEPLSNLDAKLRVEMRAEIKSLHQRLKNTIVYVTHDQVEAMTLGDRIAVMKEGLVQQFGTPAEIYESPANMYVAGFIGSPTMNFVPGTAHNAGGSSAVSLDGSDNRFPVAGSVGMADMAPVVVGIRPEHFALADADNPAAIDVHVETLEPTGADTFAVGTHGGSRLNMRFGSKSAPPKLSTVRVLIDGTAISLFNPSSELRLS